MLNLNVLISQYITKLDYNKYIPDNKLGKILKLFINRYINIWSKSVQLLLKLSVLDKSKFWVLLSLLELLIKLLLTIIVLEA